VGVSTDGLAGALSSDAAAAAPPASALVRNNGSHRSKYTPFVEARGMTCCKDHYVSLSMGGFYINVLMTHVYLPPWRVNDLECLSPFFPFMYARHDHSLSHWQDDVYVSSTNATGYIEHDALLLDVSVVLLLRNGSSHHSLHGVLCHRRGM
jgi:hypothetical protein